MSFVVSRMLVRRPQVGRIAVRHASTTTEAANAASSTATKAKDGASQGLSKVTSSASSSLSKAGSAAGNALNSIGGRTGKLINFAQCTFAIILPLFFLSAVPMCTLRGCWLLCGG